VVASRAVGLRLAFAVIHLGEQRLEAVVEDDSGRRRRVEVRQMTREPTDVPPDDWYDHVLGELSYQDSVAGLPSGLR